VDVENKHKLIMCKMTAIDSQQLGIWFSRCFFKSTALILCTKCPYNGERIWAIFVWHLVNDLQYFGLLFFKESCESKKKLSDLAEWHFTYL